MPLPDGFFKDVEGFISLPEAELLYKLASEVIPGGRIVEIGSYRGRSTIALALGARESGAIVWAIDPHPTYMQGGTQFGMADNLAYYGNIADYGVGDVVYTINLSSDQVFIAWKHEIDLLWIDGDHEFEQVQKDWVLWSSMAYRVAMHDTAGHHQAIDRLVLDIIASGSWERVEVVDAISVFQRVVT